MNTLATFPTSIQQRLDEARKLTAQNRPAEAATLLATTCTELARTNPELAAFVLCLFTGGTKLVMTSFDETITEERVKHFFGTALVPRTTTHKVTKTWEVRR